MNIKMECYSYDDDDDAAQRTSSPRYNSYILSTLHADCFLSIFQYLSLDDIISLCTCSCVCSNSSTSKMTEALLLGPSWCSVRNNQAVSGDQDGSDENFGQLSSPLLCMLGSDFLWEVLLLRDAPSRSLRVLWDAILLIESDKQSKGSVTGRSSTLQWPNESGEVGSALIASLQKHLMLKEETLKQEYLERRQKNRRANSAASRDTATASGLATTAEEAKRNLHDDLEDWHSVKRVAAMLQTFPTIAEKLGLEIFNLSSTWCTTSITAANSTSSPAQFNESATPSAFPHSYSSSSVSGQDELRSASNAESECGSSSGSHTSTLVFVDNVSHDVGAKCDDGDETASSVPQSSSAPVSTIYFSVATAASDTSPQRERAEKKHPRQRSRSDRASNKLVATSVTQDSTHQGAQSERLDVDARYPVEMQEPPMFSKSPQPKAEMSSPQRRQQLRHYQYLQEESLFRLQYAADDIFLVAAASSSTAQRGSAVGEPDDSSKSFTPTPSTGSPFHGQHRFVSVALKGQMNEGTQRNDIDDQTPKTNGREAPAIGDIVTSYLDSQAAAVAGKLAKKQLKRKNVDVDPCQSVSEPSSPASTAKQTSLVLVNSGATTDDAAEQPENNIQHPQRGSLGSRHLFNALHNGSDDEVDAQSSSKAQQRKGGKANHPPSGLDSPLPSSQQQRVAISWRVAYYCLVLDACLGPAAIQPAPLRPTEGAKVESGAENIGSSEPTSHFLFLQNSVLFGGKMFSTVKPSVEESEVGVVTSSRSPLAIEATIIEKLLGLYDPSNLPNQQVQPDPQQSTHSHRNQQNVGPAVSRYSQHQRRTPFGHDTIEGTNVGATTPPPPPSPKPTTFARLVGSLDKLMGWIITRIIDDGRPPRSFSFFAEAGTRWLTRPLLQQGASSSSYSTLHHQQRAIDRNVFPTSPDRAGTLFEGSSVNGPSAFGQNSRSNKIYGDGDESWMARRQRRRFATSSGLVGALVAGEGGLYPSYAHLVLGAPICRRTAFLNLVCPSHHLNAWISFVPLETSSDHGAHEKFVTLRSANTRRSHPLVAAVARVFSTVKQALLLMGRAVVFPVRSLPLAGAIFSFVGKGTPAAYDFPSEAQAHIDRFVMSVLGATRASLGSATTKVVVVRDESNELQGGRGKLALRTSTGAVRAMMTQREERDRRKRKDVHFRIPFDHDDDEVGAKARGDEDEAQEDVVSLASRHKWTSAASRGDDVDGQSTAMERTSRFYCYSGNNTFRLPLRDAITMVDYLNNTADVVRETGLWHLRSRADGILGLCSVISLIPYCISYCYYKLQSSPIVRLLHLFPNAGGRTHVERIINAQNGPDWCERFPTVLSSFREGIELDAATSNRLDSAAIEYARSIFRTNHVSFLWMPNGGSGQTAQPPVPALDASSTSSALSIVSGGSTSTIASSVGAESPSSIPLSLLLQVQHPHSFFTGFSAISALATPTLILCRYLQARCHVGSASETCGGLRRLGLTILENSISDATGLWCVLLVSPFISKRLEHAFVLTCTRIIPIGVAYFAAKSLLRALRRRILHWTLAVSFQQNLFYLFLDTALPVLGLWAAKKIFSDNLTPLTIMRMLGRFTIGILGVPMSSSHMDQENRADETALVSHICASLCVSLLRTAVRVLPHLRSPLKGGSLLQCLGSASYEELVSKLLLGSGGGSTTKPAASSPDADERRSTGAPSVPTTTTTTPTWQQRCAYVQHLWTEPRDQAKKHYAMLVLFEELTVWAASAAIYIREGSLVAALGWKVGMSCFLQSFSYVGAVIGI